MSVGRGALLLAAWGLVIIAYFWEALSRPVIMGERDLALFFFPAVKLWVEALQGGTFPLWNPYSFSGQPLFASLQPAVLYPPNWILPALPLVFGFNLTIALHFFLAGWFMYLLSRELGGSVGAAVVSALAFSLGGTLLSLHSVLSSLQSAVWAPLILHFLLRAMKGKALKFGLLTAGGVLVQFLGGGIEIFLLTQILVLVLIGFPRSFLSGAEAPPLSGRLKMAAGIYLLFLALGAVQILPFMEMAHHSFRGRGLSYGEATAWSLALSDLWHLVVPELFHRGAAYYFEDQNWLRSIYLGMIPLMLACFFYTGKDGRRVWWGVLLSVFLILALGKNTPLYGMLFRVAPGIDLIRFPVKFFFPAILLLCLLAGLGWDGLAEKIRKGETSKGVGLKRLALLLALINALLLLVLAGFDTVVVEALDARWPISPVRSWGENQPNLIRFAVVGLLGFLLVGFMVDRKITFRRGGGLLIGLLAVDLFLGNWGQYQVYSREAYLNPVGNPRLVRDDPSRGRVYPSIRVSRALSQMPVRDSRGQYRFQEWFEADYPAVLPSYNALGFPILVYRPYWDLIGLLETAPLPKTENLLRFLQVKFLLWPERVDDPAFKLLGTGGRHEVAEAVKGGKAVEDPTHRQGVAPHFYEVTKVLPRAFLARDYRIVKSDPEMMKAITDRSFDPAQTVLLRETPRFPESNARTGDDGETVRILGRGLNYVDLEASCPGRRLLFLSEVDYPGWRAGVDGHPQKIYRANHAFRALALGPGRHRIRMVYRPASFFVGLAVTGSTIAVLLLWAGFRRIRAGSLREKSVLKPVGPEG